MAHALYNVYTILIHFKKEGKGPCSGEAFMEVRLQGIIYENQI